MRLCNRKILKWSAWAFGTLIVMLGLYVSVFFFPYPLFPHHMEIDGFSVYSDREIPDSFKVVLKDVQRRVEAMPLFRADALPRIFVCNSKPRFEFLVKLAGKHRTGQGLLISVAGNAFFSEQGIEAVARRSRTPPTRSRLEGSWSAAIAHEVAHHLIFTEIGFLEARHIPVWKSEGYADYSANLAECPPDPSKEIHNRVAVLLDDSAWQGFSAVIDRRHFRWQVMVEYLCEVKELDLTRLLSENVTETGTWAELIDWHG